MSSGPGLFSRTTSAAATNRSRRKDAMMGELRRGSGVFVPTCWQYRTHGRPNGQLLRQRNATKISLVCFLDTRTARIH
ncbi:hypothetical protein YC2023_061222 [Brassica napus]